MNVEHLLAAADDLSGSGRRARVTDLRRAVSNTYYAAFHALARRGADQLVGSTKRQTEAWRRVYRALDHGKARDELQRSAAQALDPAVQAFALAFVDLQIARHVADYDPGPFPYSRTQVRRFIARGRAVIEGLEAVKGDVMTDLVTLLILKTRR